MYLSHLKLSDCFRHLLLHLYPDNKIEFMFNFGEISMDFNEFLAVQRRPPYLEDLQNVP